jgi:hypothetical protein
LAPGGKLVIRVPGAGRIVSLGGNFVARARPWARPLEVIAILELEVIPIKELR